MKMTMKSTDKRTKKQRRVSGMVIGVLVIAIMLFLLAGLSISNEISRLHKELDATRAALDDSLNKSVKAYMETKYLGTTNDNNGRVQGEIDFTELSDEEMQYILAAIMGSLDQYLTDDVYTGASKLAVSELKSSLNDAINKALLEMGLSSSTLSDEVTALVLKTIQSNLNEYRDNITTNASDLSSVSSSLYGLNTRVENINSSVTSLQNGYEQSINSLKKNDEVLASRIDNIMKSSSSTTTEYNQKVSQLTNEISNLRQVVNNNSNEATNNYNETLNQISNVNTNLENVDKELANKIQVLQDALTTYINEGAIVGSITPRTDGGSGNKLTLIVPD